MDSDYDDDECLTLCNSCNETKHMYTINDYVFFCKSDAKHAIKLSKYYEVSPSKILLEYCESVNYRCCDDCGKKISINIVHSDKLFNGSDELFFDENTDDETDYENGFNYHRICKDNQQFPMLKDDNHKIINVSSRQKFHKIEAILIKSKKIRKDARYNWNFDYTSFMIKTKRPDGTITFQTLE